MKTGRFMLGERISVVISLDRDTRMACWRSFSGLFVPRSALWADSGRTTAPRSSHGPHEVELPGSDQREALIFFQNHSNFGARKLLEARF